VYLVKHVYVVIKHIKDMFVPETQGYGPASIVVTQVLLQTVHRFCSNMYYGRKTAHISTLSLIFSYSLETGVYGTHTYGGQALVKLNVLAAAAMTALKEIVCVGIRSPTTALHTKPTATTQFNQRYSKRYCDNLCEEHS
jgi:hypothetical protein